MVKRLRKVYFFAPYWPLFMKIYAWAPSLEKILVRPRLTLRFSVPRYPMR